MADLKQTDIDKMTEISAQIGQDIADSIQFVESQIQGLSNELTNIAPIFATDPISKVIQPGRDDPNTLLSGGFGIDIAASPDNPIGIEDSKLDEGETPEPFTPDLQSVTFSEPPQLESVLSPEAVAPSPFLTIPGGVPGSPVLREPVFPNDPSVPSLNALDVNSIVVPDVPILDLPNFGEQLPILDVDLPDFSFEFIETEYVSPLLDAATLRLLNDVTVGGTGLGAVVEQEIYDRGLERDNRNIDLEVTRFKNQSSVSGFDLPFGVLVDGVSEIISKHDDKRADLSREIVIEQANLAQNNTQFAIAQSINIEGILINHANDVANRAFQVARSTAEFQIAFHNAEIAGYNIRLERYARGAQVHFEQLRTETVKLDLFRAGLAGVESQIGIENLKLEEFNTRMRKLTAEINLFNGQVSVVNSVNDLNRVQVQKYSAEINAFSATLAQNKDLVDLYNAQLRGSEINILRLNAEVAAHGAKIETTRLKTGQTIQELNLKLEQQRNLLTAKQQEIGIFSAVSNRVTSKEQTINTLFGNKISKFGSETEAQKTAIALEQDNVRINLDEAVKDMDRIIEVTRMNIQKNFKEWDFRTVVAQSVLAAKQFILEAGARSDDQTITNL
jgi:uncharacterized protein YjbI with pentapeptide repeats